MDIDLRETLRGCSRASDDNSASFPEVVQTLAAAGVERYHHDFMRSERTYYLPDGRSETVRNDVVHAVAPAGFSAEGVAAAVRAVQAGGLTYKAFCEQTVAAGCVGYHVSLAGRRVVYYGRTGDSHVEWFPGAR